MPTPTYTPLATTTLGSSSASVTFSSIPGTYKDLILVISGAVVTTQGNNFLYFNGDTTQSNYYYIRMLGPVSSATAANAAVSDMTTGNKNQVVVQIMNYSSTNRHKMRLSRSDQPGSTVMGYASRWANNTPVTSITFAGGNGGNLAAGTTASLYGIVG